MADLSPVYEEDAMASQSPKALQTLEETCKEPDTWSMEEGDDSVFYSDEDTAQAQVSETKGRVDSEADQTPQQEREDVQTVHVAAQEEEKMDIEHKLEHAELLVSAAEEESQRMNMEPAAPFSSKDDADSSSSGTYHPSAEEESQTRLQRGSPDSSRGPSLPALSRKKSSHPKSFNHLTSSKYSTVSYRRIRPGNTKQKIEEFEYMIINL